MDIHFTSSTSNVISVKIGAKVATFPARTLHKYTQNSLISLGCVFRIFTFRNQVMSYSKIAEISVRPLGEQATMVRVSVAWQEVAAGASSAGVPPLFMTIKPLQCHYETGLETK